MQVGGVSGGKPVWRMKTRWKGLGNMRRYLFPKKTTETLQSNTQKEVAETLQSNTQKETPKTQSSVWQRNNYTLILKNIV
jgi:hypothetical protein